MTEQVSVKRGLPPRENTVELLNDAYDDWGDEELFYWKYDKYPGFQEDHTFWIAQEGEIAAFRRLFDKRIDSTGSSSYSFFVLGDTCVAPSHRGKGLYSTLHEKTTEFCRDTGRDFSCTFNREGNITYKANLDRGWTYRTLPVQLRILSPAVVIQNYAQQALADNHSVVSALSVIGHRIGVSLSDGRLSGVDLLKESPATSGRTVHLPLSDTAVRIIIETITRENKLAAAKRHLPPISKTNIPEDVRVEIHRPKFDSCIVEKIHSFYDIYMKDYDFHFRRERRDIEHMLSHPHLEVLVTLSHNEKLVGIAPICFSNNGDLHEAQVLDLVARDRTTFEELIAQIESIAINQNADLISTVTDREISAPWIRVDKQVMMWDAYGTDTSELVSGSLLLGLYDIV